MALQAWHGSLPHSKNGDTLFISNLLICQFHEWWGKVMASRRSAGKPRSFKSTYSLFQWSINNVLWHVTCTDAVSKLRFVNYFGASPRMLCTSRELDSFWLKLCFLFPNECLVCTIQYPSSLLFSIDLIPIKQFYDSKLELIQVSCRNQSVKVKEKHAIYMEEALCADILGNSFSITSSIK